MFAGQTASAPNGMADPGSGTSGPDVAVAVFGR